MQNLKEWLNTETFEYKQAACMFGHSEWIEIPEGAEIAIKFKYDPDEFGVIFYKNNGKSCMGESDNNWQHDSEWTMDKLLNENYHDGGIDLSHEILWQRDQDEPFLTPECTLNDQYAEIEQVRQQTIADTLAARQSTYGCFEDVAFVTEGIMDLIAKVRPNGLKDIPIPHRMSLYMIASKIARLANGDINSIDGWHDIAGYATLIERLIGGDNV